MDGTVKKSSGFHYAWVIGVMSFLTLFVTIGMIVSAFAIHASYIVDEWGITKQQYSTMISVRQVAAVVSMYLCGVYYKKFSYRMGLTVGVLLGAVGSAIFGLSHGFAMGCVGAVFAGLSHGLAGMIAISVLIGNWFKKHRGLMLGAVAAASGFTTLVMPKIYVRIIEATSLNTEFFVEAIFYLVFAALIFLLVRDTPEEKGLKVYGEEEEVKEKGSARREMPKCAPTMFHQACILIMCFLIGGFSYSCTTNLSIAYTSAGFTTDAAASLLSIFGFALLIGKFLYGWISDRVPQQKATFLFFGCYILCEVLVTQATNLNFGLQVVAVCAVGLAGALATSGLAIFAIDMSTKETYAKWVRYYMVVYNIGAVVWNPIVGRLADKTGNYSVSFAMLAVLALLGLILTQTAYIGAQARYKRLSKQEQSQA